MLQLLSKVQMLQISSRYFRADYILSLKLLIGPQGNAISPPVCLVNGHHPQLAPLLELHAKQVHQNLVNYLYLLYYLFQC